MTRAIALVVVLVACASPHAERLKNPPRRHHHAVETRTILPGIGGMCVTGADCAVAVDCCGCSEGGHAFPLRVVDVPRQQQIKTAACVHVACRRVRVRDRSCSAAPACEQGRCRLVDVRDDEVQDDEGLD